MWAFCPAFCPEFPTRLRYKLWKDNASSFSRGSAFGIRFGVGVDTAGKVRDGDPHPPRMAVEDHHEQDIKHPPENQLKSERGRKQGLRDKKAADGEEFREAEVNHHAAERFTVDAFKAGFTDGAFFAQRKHAAEHFAFFAVGTAQQEADEDFVETVHDVSFRLKWAKVRRE